MLCRPRIGISVVSNAELAAYKLNNNYVEAVLAAGGLPVLLPASRCLECAEQMVGSVDGILLPGGADCSPLFYGEEPIPQIGSPNRQSDLFEFALVRAAQAAGKPILGICRGLQIINVCFGGSLWQDLEAQTKWEIKHVQDKLQRDELTHSVELIRGSHIYEIMGAETVLVNTYHHQAIKELAPGFRIGGRAKDGLVESIESENGIVAVQWHPEELQEKYPEHASLFRDLIERSRMSALSAQDKVSIA